MSPVFIIFPFMVIRTMSFPPQQDRFDSATTGRAENDHAYTDLVDSVTDEEEELLSDSDDGQLDDLRVEDEDWEIAERGLFFRAFFALGLIPSFIIIIICCRLYQTVQSTSATRCRTLPK